MLPHSLLASFKIISAAHCFGNTSSYIEVRAGLARRKSFSPIVQVVEASTIFIHEHFNKDGE